MFEGERTSFTPSEIAKLEIIKARIPDGKKDEVCLTEISNIMTEISPTKIKSWKRQEHSGTPRRGYSIVSNAEKILKKAKKSSKKKIED